MPNQFIIQFMGGEHNGLFLDFFASPKPLEEAHVFEVESEAYEIADHYQEMAGKVHHARLSVMAKPK